MEEEITVTRDGRTAKITNMGHSAKVETDRALPAGPTDWLDWCERELKIGFGHGVKVTNVDPAAGEFYLRHTGGSRETITVYDMKPRKLADGDVV